MLLNPYKHNIHLHQLNMPNKLCLPAMCLKATNLLHQWHLPWNSDSHRLKGLLSGHHLAMLQPDQVAEMTSSIKQQWTH